MKTALLQLAPGALAFVGIMVGLFAGSELGTFAGLSLLAGGGFLAAR
jgi:hypothetical protein